MYTLIADSGSTKTDWALVAPQGNIRLFHGHGLNPTTMAEGELRTFLQESLGEILQAMDIVPCEQTETPLNVRFYGAGCVGQGIDRISLLLRQITGTSNISVWSDAVAAGRALLGRHAGIVCILGTGSNAVAYDGQAISDNGVPCLGYVLGDEGGGASLGRRLVSDAAKRQLPDDLCAALFAIDGVSVSAVIENVYRGATPARYLASFVPFLAEHRAHPAIHALLVDEFSRFIHRNVLPLGPANQEPIHFVGSVALHFKAELEEALHRQHFLLGEVLKAPFDRLENL